MEHVKGLLQKTNVGYDSQSGTTVQLQGYIEGCNVAVSLTVESNVVFAMLHLAKNLNVNTMHNYNRQSGLDMSIDIILGLSLIRNSYRFDFRKENYRYGTSIRFESIRI